MFGELHGWLSLYIVGLLTMVERRSTRMENGRWLAMCMAYYM